MDQVEHRVEKLEDWAGATDKRLDDSDRRHTAAESRMDKYDANIQRVWERLDQHRDGQVRTQTLVEVGNRDIAELKASFNAFRDTAENRRIDDEHTAKTIAPARWLVWLSAGSLIVAVGSLVAIFVKGVKP